LTEKTTEVSKLIPGLVKAYDRVDKSLRLGAPIEILRKWNFKTSKNSIAMTLAHFYGNAVNAAARKTVPHLTPMQKLDYYGTDAPMTERIELFKKVIAQLRADFGKWQMPWGEVNRFQRINGDIDMTFDDNKPSIAVGLASGRWGALAAYGMRGNHDVKKIYGTRGNSFVAAVEFGDKVKAKTMLAGGQSGDPSSPHFYDQAQRYADIQFKDVAYYRDDVEARAERKYCPGTKKKKK